MVYYALKRMKKKNKKTGRRYGLQVVTLCISTTMVLVMLGLVVLSVLAARNLSVYVRENVTMNVMLGDTVTINDGVELGNMILAQPYAKHVTYISKEHALKTMAEVMGADPKEFTGVNPFEAELEVQMNADYVDADSMRQISDRLLTNEKVTDVAYMENQIDDVNRNVQRISIVLLVLSLLLLFVSYSLISSSVRLGVYSSRFLIHTMKLVGASWGFIRRPFLHRSLLIGVLSAFFACLVLGAVVYALFRYEPGAVDILTWRELAITAGSVFLFGFLIMLFCTLLSVNKFLRMTANEVYKI